MKRVLHYFIDWQKMNYSLLASLVVYGFFALLPIFIWRLNDINTVTGDEHHYLIMASGIIRYGTFEQTEPYKED